MNQLTLWWAGVPGGWRNLASSLLVVVVAYVIGKIVGYMVRERMKSFGVDELFQESASKRDFDPNKQETKARASDLFSCFFSAGIWLIGAWWIATDHNYKALADGIIAFIGKMAIFGVVAFLAMYLGKRISQAVNAFMENVVIKEAIDKNFMSDSSRNTGISETIGSIIVNVVNGFLLVFLMLTFVELANLGSLLNSLNSLWNLGIHIITAGFAFLIAYMGITFAFSRSAHDSAEKSPFPASDYHARLGIVIITTIFAVDILTTTAGTLVAMSILIILAVFLVPLREYLLDIWAGFTIDLYKIKNVTIENRSAEIKNIGFLNASLVNDANVNFSRPNREVLAAHFQQKNKLSSNPD